MAAIGSIHSGKSVIELGPVGAVRSGSVVSVRPDEMCYLVGYIRGKEGAFGCQSLATDVDAGAPSDAGPPNACMPTENAAGVGAPCTKGGNECKTGLSCSLDQSQTPDGGVGFCLRIGGCTTTADCGGGDATCCAPQLQASNSPTVVSR